jgi:hypothetical protein
MGACFNTLDGGLDRAKLRGIFDRAQEQDRLENGRCYSGGIGMASGLRVEPLPVFPNPDLAREHLEAHCEKWEEARAVRYASADGPRWIIGAWCAE